MFICHIFFTHSSIDRHLDCCHRSAIVNNAGMNVAVLGGVEIPVQLPTFNSLGNIYRSGISGLHKVVLFLIF